jgi:hypothetical protein
MAALSVVPVPEDPIVLGGMKVQLLEKVADDLQHFKPGKA